MLGIDCFLLLWLISFNNSCKGKAPVDKRCSGAVHVQHGLSDRASPCEEGRNLVWDEDQRHWVEAKLQEEEFRDVTRQVLTNRLNIIIMCCPGMGIGMRVPAGFLGGSAYSYGANLAAFSAFHM